MGRGPLGAAEAARLAVAAAVLLPLRVVAAVLLLVAYYLVCRVCTLGVEEERERDGGGEGEGYARLQGWRRDTVVRCGRALTRAMLFVFGLYWICVDDRRVADAQVVEEPWLPLHLLPLPLIHDKAAT
jgi:lysophosphatidylcholine acyltransferase/lyso-PAF acetyltransferase